MLKCPKCHGNGGSAVEDRGAKIACQCIDCDATWEIDAAEFDAAENPYVADVTNSTRI